MKRHLILNAYSSNSGGGRAGLLSLLDALPADSRTTAFIDARMPGDLRDRDNLHFVKVAPTIFGRIAAERAIRSLAGPDSWVLRLGSLPPIFKLRAPAFVFFENRHLLFDEDIDGLPFRVKARVGMERFLVWFFKRNATAFVVQSQSMAGSLAGNLGAGTNVIVLPFHSTHGVPAARAAQPEFDFIYASAGDPHKNHGNLLKAWRLLAEENIRPSLCLTVDPRSYPELSAAIDRATLEAQLEIRNVGFLPPAELAACYRRSKAVIFPSKCESFGRPIVEGLDMGLPILAPELDYVRDVVDPVQTFDPDSPRSIARAVKRHLGLKEERAMVLSPADFIADLARRSDCAP